MAKRKSNPSKNPFIYHYEMELDGFVINKGDIIKIIGEHGVKFKFNAVVTNPETGVQWIDCFELDKGLIRSWRAFSLDRAKRIPIRRKRVNRDSIG